VPAVLIGWLAKHQEYRGSNLGAVLLFEAIKTVASAPIGAHAVFAHAIDDEAAKFYASFGFIPLTEQPRTLFLPIASARQLLK
jgi:predicted GNAT family N-acyltransferase